MSMIQRGFSIAMLVLTLFGGIFLFIFLDQAMSDFLIEPLDTAAHSIVDSGVTGSLTNDTLNSLKTSYDDRPISYDIYFMVLLVIAIVSTSLAAVQAKKEGYFSMFGYIFIFSMFFLLLMFFVSQFTDYLIVNFMLPLFNDTNLDIPFILSFFDNVNVWSFIWFLWLGFIGFVDFKAFVGRITDGAESVTRGGFRR